MQNQMEQFFEPQVAGQLAPGKNQRMHVTATLNLFLVAQQAFQRGAGRGCNLNRGILDKNDLVDVRGFFVEHYVQRSYANDIVGTKHLSAGDAGFIDERAVSASQVADNPIRSIPLKREMLAG